MTIKLENVPFEYRERIKSDLINYHINKDKLVFYIHPEKDIIEQREIMKHYFITRYP